MTNKKDQPAMSGLYRKKPVVIEAYRLPIAPPGGFTNAALEDAVFNFISWCKKVGFDNYTSERDGDIAIETLEGTMTANPGDWIIKGVAGEFYPCKPEIFAATYEPAAPQSPVAPADEREAFVGWLSTSYPQVYDCGDAERLWRLDHVAALSWQARARLADAPAVADVNAAYAKGRADGWDAAKAPTVSATVTDAALLAEAKELSDILAGMVEGNYDIDTLYNEDQSDGDAFVRRAADLLAVFAAPMPPTSAADALPNVQRLIDAHAKLIEDGNSYAYFELAYTRHTEWMAWLCTNARENDPERKVIAKGQGSTPDEACLAAIAAIAASKEGK